MSNLNLLKTCYKFADVITDAESGETICTNCGMVMSNDKLLQYTPGWRAFDANQMRDRSRVGMPSTLTRHDQGLSTVIGRPDMVTVKTLIEYLSLNPKIYFHQEYCKVNVINARTVVTFEP
jgi:transcription initiation factor TFIIIB Brf1 subunit/transcription initiation factor TFIIB